MTPFWYAEFCFRQYAKGQYALRKKSCYIERRHISLKKGEILIKKHNNTYNAYNLDFSRARFAHAYFCHIIHKTKHGLYGSKKLIARISMLCMPQTVLSSLNVNGNALK